MVLRFLPALCVVVWMLGASANAQTGGGTQSGYTLQANTRVVLTDVTVTDRQGNPVRGLKASDFRIFDNKKPQEIASFEEHSRDDTAATPQPVSTPGIYSNDYLVHPPRVLNVVFLDLTNISIEDQMYLRYQLGKFFDTLSPNDPVAIYARTGGASILLQGFTSDRTLLHAAVKKIMPRFPPFGRQYLSDFDTLQHMEIYLGQIPGRKNVLWFTGGRSMLSLQPDASLLAPQPMMRDIYDELEKQRIAIYPIDARGLTVSSSHEMLAQHALMSEVAEATGGQALYDNNGLALAAERIIHDDGDYYTLTYSPHNFRYDNKWHKVNVTIPGTYYTLSYRRGYFADGSNPVKEKAKLPRTRLLANGETAKDLPNSTAPIIFQASVVQARARAVSSGADSAKTKPPRRGMARFVVRYSLPLDAFEMTNVNGKQTVQCAAAVLAFNDNGTVVAHRAEEITFTLKDEAAADPVGKLLPVDVDDIDLAQGDVYLFIAAWDMKSKRLGTLEIPYHVDRVQGPQDTRASK